MAEQLVENLAERSTRRYTDEYRANLMGHQGQDEGQEAEFEEREGEERDSGVLDLMSRLRQSRGSWKERRRRPRKRKSVAASRKPAKTKKTKTA
jgi:non-homologous end joining protein Ku